MALIVNNLVVTHGEPIVTIVQEQPIRPDPVYGQERIVAPVEQRTKINNLVINGHQSTIKDLYPQVIVEKQVKTPRKRISSFMLDMTTNQKQ